MSPLKPLSTFAPRLMLPVTMLLAGCETELPPVDVTAEVLGMSEAGATVELRTGVPVATVSIDGVKTTTEGGHATVVVPLARVGGGIYWASAPGHASHEATQRLKYPMLVEVAAKIPAHNEPPWLRIVSDLGVWGMSNDHPSFARMNAWRTNGSTPCKLSLMAPPNALVTVGELTQQVDHAGKSEIECEDIDLLSYIPAEAYEDGAVVALLRVPAKVTHEGKSVREGHLSIYVSLKLRGAVAELARNVANGKPFSVAKAKTPTGTFLVDTAGHGTRLWNATVMNEVKQIAIASEVATKPGRTCDYYGGPSVRNDIITVEVALYDAHAATKLRSKRFVGSDGCPVIAIGDHERHRSTPSLDDIKKWLLPPSMEPR